MRRTGPDAEETSDGFLASWVVSVSYDRSAVGGSRMIALLPAVRRWRMVPGPLRPPGAPSPWLPGADVSGDDRVTQDGAAQEIEFRRFVAARWSALQRYAFLLTGDHQIAEDVVQTALERCWRRWGRITNDAPEGYVRAAIANTAASRRRRRRPGETSLEGLLVPPAEPGDHAESHALRSGLWAALRDLPPRQRTIVVLRLWEDQSVEETARRLGISTGAVKSAQSKALSRLREHPQVRELLAGPRTEVE